MRNKVAYSLFERIIIFLYDEGMLTQHLLDTLANTCRGAYIDTVGGNYLKTKDGKDLQDICLEIADPTFIFVEAGSAADNDEYWEDIENRWRAIIRNRWGWQ